MCNLCCEYGICVVLNICFCYYGYKGRFCNVCKYEIGENVFSLKNFL